MRTAWLGALLSASLLAGSAHGQFQEPAPQLPATVSYFDWIFAERDLVLLPIPFEVALEDIVDARLDGPLEVLSVGFDSNPRQVEFLVRPLTPYPIHLDRYTLTLTAGEEHVHHFGRMVLVPVTELRGQLRPQEFVSAPGASMILAALLWNDGPGGVELERVEYLVADPEGLAMRAHVSADPFDAWRYVTGTPFPALHGFEPGIKLRGFESIDPTAPGLTIPAGEAVILVWLPDAFPDRGGGHFRFRPIVTFSDEAGVSTSLGLPPTVRYIPELDRR